MKTYILGVKIDKTTVRETIERIGQFLSSNRGHYIITANPEMLVAAQKDAEFREIINNADLVAPDGFGLILASKILRGKNGLTERISGIDLIIKIAENFGSDHKIFLLGGQEGVAKMATEKLKEKFPDIKISGFFGGDASEAGDIATISAINQANPDILFIAFGAPKQEKWIARNLKKMPGIRLAIGVGGAFDIISGRIKRAPQWMRRLGLEWFWRLIQEPRRIGRIYNATIKFMWLVVIKQKLSRDKKKDKMWV